jgi:RHS repeat-associated protein
MGVVGDINDTWYHYRARAYRAEAGRFVQRDSEFYADGNNLYGYTNNSPLNFTDPQGTASIPSCGAGCLGSGTGMTAGLVRGFAGFVGPAGGLPPIYVPHTPPIPPLGPHESANVFFPPPFPAGIGVKISCQQTACGLTNTQCEGTGSTCTEKFIGPAIVTEIFGGGMGQLTCLLEGWDCFCANCPPASRCSTTRRQICVAKAHCIYISPNNPELHKIIAVKCQPSCPRACFQP